MRLQSDTTNKGSISLLMVSTKDIFIGNCQCLNEKMVDTGYENH